MMPAVTGRRTGHVRLLVLFLLVFGVPTGAFAQADSIAYHPNAWWTVPGRFAQPGRGAFAFRNFLPQYNSPYRFADGRWSDADWRAWQIRYGAVAPYPVTGHAWPVFIRARKDVLTQHPEYLAEIDGQRLGIAKTSKLCVAIRSSKSCTSTT